MKLQANVLYFLGKLQVQQVEKCFLYTEHPDLHFLHSLAKKKQNYFSPKDFSVEFMFPLGSYWWSSAMSFFSKDLMLGVEYDIMFYS